MAKYQDVFKRYEKKYMLTYNQYDCLRNQLKDYMKEDNYGLHTICTIYYDTQNYELIRNSIEKPLYKEKLRLRSYGIPKPQDIVFLEIKKKYEGIVYKRRSQFTLDEVKQFSIWKHTPTTSNQINNEIIWFFNTHNPVPKVFIGYDRLALFGIENPNVRITFDQNIHFRDYDLDLSKGNFGQKVLDPGKILMEIKIPGSFPLWLSHILSDLRIYPTSFSKYGSCYKKYIANKFHEKGDVICV